MSCPHAQTTTILWIYGEADEAHATHVAGCAICQRVLQEHEQVHLALSLDGSEVEHSPVSQPPEIPEPVNTSRFGAFLGLAGVCAAAAAVLLTWYTPDTIESIAPNISPDIQIADTIAMTQDEPWDFDGFGDELDDPFGGLEDDLAWLEEDLSTL